MIASGRRGQVTGWCHMTVVAGAGSRSGAVAGNSGGGTGRDRVRGGRGFPGRSVRRAGRPGAARLWALPTPGRYRPGEVRPCPVQGPRGGLSRPPPPLRGAPARCSALSRPPRRPRPSLPGPVLCGGEPAPGAGCGAGTGPVPAAAVRGGAQLPGLRPRPCHRSAAPPVILALAKRRQGCPPPQGRREPRGPLGRGGLGLRGREGCAGVCR